MFGFIDPGLDIFVAETPTPAPAIPGAVAGLALAAAVLLAVTVCLVLA